VFPEHKWDLLRFKTKPRNYWSSQENRRKALIDIGSQLGIKEGDYESWQKVEYRDLRRLGAASLLTEFGDSTSKMLISVFPEHLWNLEKFKTKPRHYWEFNENHKSALLEVGKKLGIKEGDFEAWYKVKADDIRAHGGQSLLPQYGNSPSEIIVNLFPEHDWNLALFPVKPRYYFKSIETQREFILEMARKLGFKEGNFEMFYKITTSDFSKYGGYSLLDLYSRSLRVTITSVFPEHQWLPWKFNVQATKWFWADPDSMFRAVKHIEEKLKITDFNGFYRVGVSQIKDLELHGYLKSKDLLLKLLRSVYPEHDWNGELLAKGFQKNLF
jgi:hypothetical protein